MFFADSLIHLGATPQAEVPLPFGAESLAALEIWQARVGEIFSCRAPDGTFWRCRLADFHDQGGEWVPFAQLAVAPESRLTITACVALPEKERFELILQKLTELGVQRILPFTSRRSISLEERDAGQKKSHRWPDVLLRAARQCRRAVIPQLDQVVDWSTMLQESASADLRLLLYEGEAGWTFREGIGKERPHHLVIISGPEGGFDRDEVEEAQMQGVVPVTLGGRIVRTETAAIVGATLAQHILGDLG